jgi:CRISPR-associated protein Cas5d
MAHKVGVKVTGALACFTRPEAKVERVSYMCMTPSAARGVLEAILWKPEFQWLIHAVTVLRPIQFTSIRRNEIEDKINIDSTVKGRSSALEWMEGASRYTPYYADLQKLKVKGFKDIPGNRVQRHTLALRDVGYAILAEPQLTEKANKPRRKPRDVVEPEGGDTVEKYVGMFNRRVAKGQCFQQPYLGLREFVAAFQPGSDEDKSDPSDPVLRSDEYPLGRLFYDFDYRADGTRIPLFAAAVLRRGVLDVDEMRRSLPAQGARHNHDN